MKCKKIVSGLLALSLVATSVFTGELTTAKAAEMPTPVATYSFDGQNLGSDEVSGNPNAPVASAMVTGYSAYTGNVEYVEGRTAEDGDYAVNLNGKHGIVLPEENLGTSYTVSLWVNLKDDVNNFAPLLALGNDNIPKWMTIAGAHEGNNLGSDGYNENEDHGQEEQYIIWGTDIEPAKEMHFSFPKNEWVMLTVAQTGTDVTLYKNGVVAGTMTAPFEILNGEGQGIHIGMNLWDQMFPGYVDDVVVYNTELTPAQILYLYDGTTEEEYFEENGFTASETVSVNLNGTKKIKVSCAISDAKVSFESADESIATVGADGEVTGVAAGTTTVKVTVEVGSVKKTTDVAITVRETVQSDAIAVDYDFTNIENGIISDKSGKDNDATVKGVTGASVVKDGEKTVLQLSGTNTYIELPSSIMEDLTDTQQFTIETKFAKSASCGSNAWLFCLGSKTSQKNYMFVSPHFGGTTLRAGIKGTSETLFETDFKPLADVYYTCNLVFDDGDLRLYMNGALIDEIVDENWNIMEDVVTPGTENNILGWIGKSCYTGDGNYQGKIESFKIYDRAFNDEDLKAVFESNIEDITEADFLGRNTSVSAVQYNMTLPSTVNGIDVTWTSDTPEVITNDGKVLTAAEKVDVTLTAAIKSGEMTATKDFVLTVVTVDTTQLKDLIKKAEAVCNNEKIVESTKEEVRKAITEAEEKMDAAVTQSEINTLINAIKSALNKTEYIDGYENPFAQIDESAIPASYDMQIGGTATFFTVPAAIKDMVTVAYESSDPAIAVVDAAGLVTAKAAGNAYVTAVVTSAHDGYAVEYKTLVKVAADPASIKPVTTTVKMAVTAAETTLVQGQSTDIAVTAPTEAVITYRAKGAVSVNPAGKVTGKKGGVGTVYVKIQLNGKKYTKKLTFNVGAITGKSTVKVKKSITLKVAGISGKVKWSVDKKKYAAITQKGKLKAKKKGKVTVTAKVGNYTMKKTIKITK